MRIITMLNEAHLFHETIIFFQHKSGKILCLFSYWYEKNCSPGSSVGIATKLRAGRSGIEYRCESDFPPVQTGPVAHPASCKMGTGSFPGVKCGRGVLLTTLTPFQCRGHGRVELYLYPQSGPHRACNGITLHLTIISVLIASRCTSSSCRRYHSRKSI